MGKNISGLHSVVLRLRILRSATLHCVKNIIQIYLLDHIGPDENPGFHWHYGCRSKGIAKYILQMKLHAMDLTICIYHNQQLMLVKVEQWPKILLSKNLTLKSRSYPLIEGTLELFKVIQSEIIWYIIEKKNGDILIFFCPQFWPSIHQ